MDTTFELLVLTSVEFVAVVTSFAIAGIVNVVGVVVGAVVTTSVTVVVGVVVGRCIIQFTVFCL